MAHGVVEDEPEILWGMEDGLIYGLIFDNVTIANETAENFDYFHQNEYVFNRKSIQSDWNLFSI